MRFLVDECTGPAVAHWLRGQNYEVYSIYEESSGMEDDEVIAKAFPENWILITNDKDFGEKVYRERKPHKGIILLRLEDERTFNKIEALRRLLQNYTSELPNRFIVVTDKQVRIAHSSD